MQQERQNTQSIKTQIKSVTVQQQQIKIEKEKLDDLFPSLETPNLKRNQVIYYIVSCDE